MVTPWISVLLSFSLVWLVFNPMSSRFLYLHVFFIFPFPFFFFEYSTFFSSLKCFPQLASVMTPPPPLGTCFPTYSNDDDHTCWPHSCLRWRGGGRWSRPLAPGGRRSRPPAAHSAPSRPAPDRRPKHHTPHSLHDASTFLTYIY